MRHLCITSLLSLTAAVVAHPGGGIAAMGPTAVIIGDPMNNVVWRIEKGKAPIKLVEKFHCHWLTKSEMEDSIYIESMQEMGGGVYRMELKDPVTVEKLVKVSYGDPIKGHVFAVAPNGLVYQEGNQIIIDLPGSANITLRPVAGDPPLATVLAFAWGPKDMLYLSDGNHIRVQMRRPELHINQVRTIATIRGTFLQPRIWNPVDVPKVTGLAVDGRSRVYAAVPDIGEVIRIDTNGRQEVISRSQGGWRATGVATHGDSVFLMESHDKQNIGPRVRVLRPSGEVELIGRIE